MSCEAERRALCQIRCNPDSGEYEVQTEMPTPIPTPKPSKSPTPAPTDEDDALFTDDRSTSAAVGIVLTLGGLCLGAAISFLALKRKWGKPGTVYTRGRAPVLPTSEGSTGLEEKSINSTFPRLYKKRPNSKTTSLPEKGAAPNRVRSKRMTLAESVSEQTEYSDFDWASRSLKRVRDSVSSFAEARPRSRYLERVLSDKKLRFNKKSIFQPSSYYIQRALSKKEKEKNRSSKGVPPKSDKDKSNNIDESL